MDKILESLFESRIVETTQSAKDKKQRNKYPQTRLRKAEETKTIGNDNIDIVEDAEAWENEERRNGSERRQEQSERGRYFESRDKSNRRIKKELHIKI